MAVARLSAFVSFIGCLAMSLTVQAANPFKKSVDFDFPDNINWVLKNKTAVKTGQVKEGSDTLYYHLSINDKQLRLRFSKNDPTGQVINSRSLSSLVIEDVLIDGQRMPLFQWCINNQQLESREFKQDTPVAQNACVNTAGDFIMNLNNQSREMLKKAGTLEVVSEPFRRTEILSFGMSGYTTLMKKLEKPVVAKPVKAPAKPVPVAKPKKVAKKVVKTCFAKAPAEYKNIKPAAYPCPDAAGKSVAEAKIAKLVASKKKAREAAAAAAAQAAASQKQKAQASEIDKAAEARAEAEWEKRQTAMWTKRCQKHWRKGVSPCYCQKYISNAPAGVKDTCPAK